MLLYQIQTSVSDTGGAIRMDVERNKRSVRRVFEEAWNRGRLEVVDECLAAGAVDRHELAPGEDFRTHLKGIITMLRASMPDLHMQVDDLVGEGDRVAARVTLTGTYTGQPLGEAPPEGQKVRVEQFHIVEFDDDARCIRHWANVNEGELFAQLTAVSV
jgi:predicted ester cyclase